MSKSITQIGATATKNETKMFQTTTTITQQQQMATAAVVGQLKQICSSGMCIDNYSQNIPIN
jgi:hypothetical protein